MRTCEFCEINTSCYECLKETIERVRELHKKIPARNSDLEYTCQECYAFYSHYEYEYPCLTIQVLDGKA
jgi:hypothetical protein